MPEQTETLHLRDEIRKARRKEREGEIELLVGLGLFSVVIVFSDSFLLWIVTLGAIVGLILSAHGGIRTLQYYRQYLSLAQELKTALRRHNRD